jgi:hypothetical protein
VRINTLGSDEILTSGPLPLFTPDQPLVTAGFFSLLNLLVASAISLGYPPHSGVARPVPPLTLPDDFFAAGARVVPHRTGHGMKPNVFFIGQVRADMFGTFVFFVLRRKCA